MSWSGFGKNKDTRKKCTLCNETGHLARECANQSGPTPAPAPAPPPPPARSYASAAATPVTQSGPAKKRFDPVAIPLRSPAAAKPNPAAAAFTPAPSSTAAPPIPSTVRTAITAPSPRPTAAASGPAASSSQKSLGSTEEKHERGLRIGYGTRNDRLPVKNVQQAPTVLTNYVRITNRPKYVFVYKLEIVRETGANGEEHLTKNRVEKKAIFDQLKLQNDYRVLQTRRDYATDHDLIWATKPLFPELKGEPSAPRPTQRFPVSHPHTQQRIGFEEVRIHYLKCIDASQSPLDLLRNSEQSPDRADDGVVLIRGINAFMTQHARDNMDAQHYVSTAANRFFLTQEPHEKHLDKPHEHALRAFRGFSVSTRPGVDHMLLNIHVGASPFLENASIQQLISRLKDMRLPPRQAFNVFKNKEAVIGRSKRRVIITRIGDTKLEDHMQSWPRLRDELSRLNYRQDLSDLPVYVTPQGLNNSEHAADVRLHGPHAFRGVMSDAQTTAMLEFACKVPIHNRRYLEDSGFTMLGINTPPVRARANEFGMSVETSLLRVPARYLAPPALRYRDNVAPVAFKEASWNLYKRQFFVSSTSLRQVMILDLHQLHKWGRTQPDLRDLRTGLATQLRFLGLGQVQVTTAGDAEQLVAQDAPTERFPDDKRLI